MDQDFRPINYRRTNVRFKYSRAQDELKGKEYYHMPPLCANPPVKINNNKKYQKEEERITQIERSNRILFEKMRNIRLKKGPYSQPQFNIKRRSYSNRGHINKTADTIHNEIFQQPNTQIVRTKSNYKDFETLPQKIPKRHTSVPPIRIQKNDKASRMKILYKQDKQIDGKRYALTAYIQNGQFWLKADEEGGSLSNYMHMDMADYKRLEKFYLPNGIQSLLEHIKIGEVIELKGLDQQSKMVTMGQDLEGEGEDD